MKQTACYPVGWSADSRLADLMAEWRVPQSSRQIACWLGSVVPSLDA